MATANSEYWTCCAKCGKVILTATTSYCVNCRVEGGYRTFRSWDGWATLEDCGVNDGEIWEKLFSNKEIMIWVFRQRNIIRVEKWTERYSIRPFDYEIHWQMGDWKYRFINFKQDILEEIYIGDSEPQTEDFWDKERLLIVEEGGVSVLGIYKYYPQVSQFPRKRIYIRQQNWAIIRPQNKFDKSYKGEIKMKFKICEKCKINFTENGEQYCRYCAPKTDKIPVGLVVGNGKQNKIIRANTHAEFLNTVFKTNYKRWMKCVWNYSPNILVWMVKFYGEIWGWQNRFVDEDTIVETCINPLQQDASIPKEEYRIVVAVEDRGVPRRYEIKGLFRFCKEESTWNRRVHKRVKDDTITPKL